MPENWKTSAFETYLLACPTASARPGDKKANSLTRSDRRITVNELATELDVSHGSAKPLLSRLDIQKCVPVESSDH